MLKTDPNSDVFIKYQNQYLYSGKLDDMSDNIYQATINYKLPIAADNDETQYQYSYHLYVGEQIDIVDCLKIARDPQVKRRLADLRLKGFKQAVIPKFITAKDNKSGIVIFPIYGQDVVFSTYDEFIQAIAQIKNSELTQIFANKVKTIGQKSINEKML